jgi:hypothetical protein
MEMPTAANHAGTLIRVVSFQEGPWLVAQCLDVDIAAQGKTEDELLYQLTRLLVGRIMAAEEFGIDDPFAKLPRAPQKYWDMFNAATSPSAKVVLTGKGKETTAQGMPVLEMKKAA